MRPIYSIASMAATLRNRLDDLRIERRLGIRTGGRRDVEFADAVPYSTFAYHAIERVLDRLALGPEDVFADVGCGKGRVACAAALQPVRRVIGIDVDERLCAAARENARRLRPAHAPIEIVHAPAQAFDYRECTALLLFNPFNAGTLRAVLENAAGAPKSPPARSLRLAYVNPRCEGVLHDMPAFERYDHWPRRAGGRVKFEVSFWRLRGARAKPSEA